MITRRSNRDFFKIFAYVIATIAIPAGIYATCGDGCCPYVYTDCTTCPDGQFKIAWRLFRDGYGVEGVCIPGSDWNPGAYALLETGSTDWNGQNPMYLSAPLRIDDLHAYNRYHTAIGSRECALYDVEWMVSNPEPDCHLLGFQHPTNQTITAVYDVSFAGFAYSVPAGSSQGICEIPFLMTPVFKYVGVKN